MSVPEQRSTALVKPVQMQLLAAMPVSSLPEGNAKMHQMLYQAYNEHLRATELHEAHLHSSPSNIEHCLPVGAMYLPNKMHCSLIQILHMEPLCVRRGCRACCRAESGVLPRSATIM